MVPPVYSRAGSQCRAELERIDLATRKTDFKTDPQRAREIRQAADQQRERDVENATSSKKSTNGTEPVDSNARTKYLTPDERRILRRQIQDAGSEIYPPQKN